ncbi:hypothetical protein [Streptomyces scabiei]|uniref:hypothetical protein n=1 Tax=Streptomyces scabiei TaxID=1930 RepID=UPI001B32D822|nr:MULTISPECIES: hypothetical protein [Streptomyces]MBP5892803.1 hypothetical protein [Streptomyces sp. LBUM 1481]MBP5923069.1 hypothetical protein [Streptomyces sp. LBUM 1483]MDX2686877.1 hypothetical protein [Streptomyces scabiei]MDX2753087.1 hypothetical protein [Streptomyces scabiei]MDX2807276.1 hypothetical protein [Streptomyces scabiei]
MAKVKTTTSKKASGPVDIAKRVAEGLARPMAPVPTPAADAARIILQLEKNHAAMNAMGLGSPALDEFNALVIRQVAEADDPAATYDAILQLMRDHRAGATA